MDTRVCTSATQRLSADPSHPARAPSPVTPVTSRPPEPKAKPHVAPEPKASPRVSPRAQLLPREVTPPSQEGDPRRRLGGPDAHLTDEVNFTLFRDVPVQILSKVGAWRRRGEV